MYTTYHVRYKGKVPKFVILVTLDDESGTHGDVRDVVKHISSRNVRARVVNNPDEAEMFWQIRRASYSLSKFQDESKRPAAFLEDITVPPENLSKFFMQIEKLFKEFNIKAAVHGHGGNGHFHFYPLLDFTKKTTPALVEKMAEAFYSTAVKYNGDICGEHNDGIIRTPYLDKMFSKKMISILEETQDIFDPHDIFNPGKKVNPKFDIRHNIRTTN
jgi:FAD/FMN-containing dehydrogenase